MKKTVIDKIKKLLIEQKENLEKELSAFAIKAKNASADFKTKFPDYGDKNDENSNEVAQFSDNLALEGALEKSIRDIDKALNSIDQGTYGICKYCKQPIDEKRLEARPTSSSCVQCKQRLKAL